MNLFQYLHLRWLLWRLEGEAEGLKESADYYQRTGYLCLGRATEERRKLRAVRERLEQIATQLGQGNTA